MQVRFEKNVDVSDLPNYKFGCHSYDEIKMTFYNKDKKKKKDEVSKERQSTYMENPKGEKLRQDEGLGVLILKKLCNIFEEKQDFTQCSCTTSLFLTNTLFLPYFPTQIF